MATKRMLIDATHREETRVVVLNGNRLDEFDFETSTKKQLKGNIYLAKVTRVEPSLQACFVEFGGNRHGFLAFNEIHPDYWRIPIADREALLAEQRRYDDEDDQDDAPRADARRTRATEPQAELPASLGELPPELIAPPTPPGEPAPWASEPSFPPAIEAASTTPPSPSEIPALANEPATIAAPLASEAAGWDAAATPPPTTVEIIVSPHAEATSSVPLDATPALDAPPAGTGDGDGEISPPHAPLESIGGDQVDDDDDDDEDDEENEPERRRARFKPMRHYKIQEVIKRRQVLLVQVVKEERGTKGAALTTYLSLAGRYCVLMPNTTRGGGISRRITSQQDRKRLKEIMHDLEVPDGMAVILRTAGMERSKQEIRRDYEYLMRLWDEVRDRTLTSTAPTLVYEEGSLIKRTIRDLYSRDIDEILVEGRDGQDAARNFMKTLMPDHVDKIRLYDDPVSPLFQRFQVEAQLDEIHDNTVRLRSGGYIVFGQTEALVAIDVNSGKSTRERHIEETAFKTNLEAAEEIARQLRLRDLAGLIVIDFIDMEDNRNIAAVERRLKEAMRVDRARIQIGRISPFGLLELSRQRLRPSLAEVSSQRCPHCGGSGIVRSTESTALRVLRGIEQEGMKSRAAALRVSVPASIALYILNQKRQTLTSIEQRYGLEVNFDPDDALVPPNFRLERLKSRERAEAAPTGPAPVRAGDDLGLPPPPTIDSVDDHEDDRDHEESVAEPAIGAGRPERAPAPGAGPVGDDESGRRRRRRRRRGRSRRDDNGAPHGAGDRPGIDSMASGAPEARADQPSAFASHVPDRLPAPSDAAAADNAGLREPEAQGSGNRPSEARSHDGRAQPGDEFGGHRRRRGRRGGRRRRGGEPNAVGAPPPVTTEIADTTPAPRDVDDELRARAREIYAQASRSPSAEASTETGTGSAHEWPWNRPSEPAPTMPVAAMSPERGPVAVPPIPAAIETPPLALRADDVATPVPAPAPAALRTPEPPPVPVIEPEPEPKGPPRKGWWRRLMN